MTDSSAEKGDQEDAGVDRETGFYVCLRCRTEGVAEAFDDIDHKEWCRHGR